MSLIFLSAFMAGLSYSVAPGVINAEAIRRGLTHGFRASLLFQVGTLAGIMVWAAIALSSAVVIRSSTGLSLVLGFCGALFLIWMGWGAFRDSRRAPVLGAVGSSGQADLLSGALLSLMNPFTGVFWLSIGGNLLSANTLMAPVHAVATILSAFILAALIWSVLVATIASYGRRLVHATAFRWLNAGAGTGMVLFGFGLFWQTLAAL
jgi:threonine/homoserine/homoserine lactone efflux protein